MKLYPIKNEKNKLKDRPGQIIVSASNQELLEDKELMDYCLRVIKEYNKARQTPSQVVNKQ